MSHYNQKAVDNYLRWKPLIEDADRGPLEALTMLLLQQRAVNGLCGRQWDAVCHHEWETDINSMLTMIELQRERMISEHLRIMVRVWVPGRNIPICETQEFQFSDEYCDIMKWVMDATHKLIHD